MAGSSVAAVILSNSSNENFNFLNSSNFSNSSNSSNSSNFSNSSNENSNFLVSTGPGLTATK